LRRAPQKPFGDLAGERRIADHQAGRRQGDFAKVADQDLTAGVCARKGRKLGVQLNPEGWHPRRDRLQEGAPARPGVNHQVGRREVTITTGHDALRRPLRSEPLLQGPIAGRQRRVQK
jgi:hypothetical protein